MRTPAGYFFLLFLFSCDAGTRSAGEPATVPVDSVQPVPAAHAADAENDTATYTETIYDEYLTQEVKACIAQLPGWQLPPPREWDAYWFNRHKTGSALVNVAPLDVDCDRQTDYAVLLYNENDKRIGLWVVRHEGGECVADSVDSFVNNPGNYGIAVIRDSEVRDMYEDEPVVIACDAIDFIKFESASRTYYFTGK